MKSADYNPRDTAFWNMIRAVAFRTLPDSLLERRRAARKSDLFRGAGVVFIHVPKAAGTSIGSALFGGHIGHFTIRDVLVACPHDVVALPRFTLVRNSWERAVSAYQFARSGQGQSGQTARIRNPHLYQGEDCATFERFVENRLAGCVVDKLDYVFRTQTYFITDADGGMPFGHIGQLDRLNETEIWLSETLGRKIRLGQHNRTNYKSWREFYTPQLAQLVGEIYRKDIETFGFEF